MVLSSYDFPYNISPLAGLVELRSFFFASVALTVSLVLAYLTNPNEASFRSFLTELAFRRHLTKLNDRGDHSQDRHPNQPSSGLHYASSPPRDGTQDGQTHSNPTSLVGGLAAPSNSTPISTSLTFSNRAAVSLRTPGHFFRSFGIFTIAIVTPLTDSPSSQALKRRQSRLQPPSGPSHNSTGSTTSASSTSPKWTPGPTLASQSSVIDGSWFIGAFGKWWVGGSVEVPSKDAHLLSKEEGVPPGILSMRSLVITGPSNAHAAPVTKSSPAQTTSKVTRRRSVQNKSNANGVTSEGSTAFHPPARSTTPPPLPKSASLPLHAVRTPLAKDSAQPSRTSNGPTVNTTPATPSLPHVTTLSATVPAPVVASPSQPFPVAEPQSTLSVSSPPNPSHSRSRTLSSHLAALDANPLIADLLSQVQASQAAVTETRQQLQSFQATSQSVTSVLQSSVEAHRSSKRVADQTKLDQKARLKTLEDSKRHAESVKRDAEKKLKGTIALKEQAEAKINKLTFDAQKLHMKVSDDEAKQLKSGLDASAAESEMKKLLESKKKELKTAEETVTSLGTSARNLEEKIKEEKERLVKVKEEAMVKRRERVERNLKESSTSSLAVNVIPVAPVPQQARQPSTLQSKPAPMTSGTSQPKTDSTAIAPAQAQQQAPKTILQRRVSVSRAPVLSGNSGGVGLQAAQPQQQQRSPPALTLLQRRNVPEPEPLTIVPASSNHGVASHDQKRARAMSLGGNQGIAVVNMGMNGAPAGDVKNAPVYAAKSGGVASATSGPAIAEKPENESDAPEPPGLGPVSRSPEAVLNAPFVEPIGRGSFSQPPMMPVSATRPTVPTMSTSNVGMASIPTPPPTFGFSPFSDSDSDIGETARLSVTTKKSDSMGLGLGVPNDGSVDSGLLSPLASSLLPKGLFKSLDAEGSPRTSMDVGANFDMDGFGSGVASGVDFGLDDDDEDVGFYGAPNNNSRYFNHAHVVHQSPPNVVNQGRRSRGNSVSMSPYMSTSGPFAPRRGDVVDGVDFGNHSLHHVESWPTSMQQSRQDYQLHPQLQGYGVYDVMGGGEQLSLHSSPELAMNNSTANTSPNSLMSAAQHAKGNANFGFGRNMWNSPGTDESHSSMFDSYVGPPLRPSISREQEVNSGQMTEGEKAANKGRTGAHRKWFSSGSSNIKESDVGGVHPRSTTIPGETPSKKKEKGLNPDAKAFSFTRGRSILLNSVAAFNGNGNGAVGDLSTFGPPGASLQSAPMPPSNPSLASRLYGSLSQTLQPHRQQTGMDHNDGHEADLGSGGNFFSSLKAFAPSPAERQALQRALGNGSSGVVGGGLNQSHEYLPASSFTSSIGAANIDHSPMTGGMVWDGEVYQQNEQVPAQPRSAKRGFSSLWSRGSKPPVLVERVEPPYHLPDGVAEESGWHVHGGFGGGVVGDEFSQS